LEHLNEVRKNDLQKQLLIGAFHHSIQNEHEMLCLTDHVQRINEQLKKILESVVHAPLMIVITDTLIDLSRIYPQIFQDIFVVCFFQKKYILLISPSFKGCCGYSYWMVY
jgi:hypothetical protein